MPLIVPVLASCIIFLAAYFTYGRFLTRHFGLDASRKTPACELNDGVDYVPAKKIFLLGQHFSAIAAAGPIVGPIMGAMLFGWLPALLWIVFGSVFFGAMHDFSSLAGSVRHQAASIVEMMGKELGKTGHVLFMIFVWLSLLYVITAFTDLTSAAFLDPELGGATASSSLQYLALGILMGVALTRLKLPLRWATPIFLVLVIAAVWSGPMMPLRLPAFIENPRWFWNTILLVYCFAASLAPVWILLQPRGYLGGFFLYGTLLAGMIGLLMGNESVRFPAFTGWVSDKGLPLFPLLFVTVACGACSGFHGIVCSGTTSKQIEKETDCRLIGYGGMLLEGVVAVLSLGTLLILTKTEASVLASPDRIYAEGLSNFVAHLGIPVYFARSFALLAFATFIYDTLDVATRLARQIFQEITGWKGALGRVGATLLTLIVPLACISLEVKDVSGQTVPAWKVFWTIFGTSNQLLAALTLMMLSLYLKRNEKNWLLAAVPMVLMMGMTFWSLALLVWPKGGSVWGAPQLVGAVLLVVSSWLLVEAAKAVRTKKV